MSSSSRTIASLNASAVSLIQRDRYEEANTVLRNAIEAMKHLSSGSGDSAASNVANGEVIPTSPPPHVSSHVRGGQETHQDNRELQRRYDSVALPNGCAPSLFNSGVFPIFNRGILVNVDVENDHAFPGEVDRRLIATLLYNTALLHHIRGIRTGESELLTKALSLYQGAFVSLTGMWNRLQKSDTLLILALLNNMGHIRAHNFDRKEACCCLDMLKHFFSESGGDQTLIEEESLFFYLTTFIFANEPLITSPAA